MKIESNREKEMLRKIQSEMKQKMKKLNKPDKNFSVKASPAKWDMKTVYQRLKPRQKG